MAEVTLHHQSNLEYASVVGEVDLIELSQGTSRRWDYARPMEQDLVFLLECNSNGGEVLRYETLPSGVEQTSEYRTVDEAGSDSTVKVPAYAFPHEP